MSRAPRVVDPRDDLVHEPDPARERWRESYYWQFFDFRLGIGGYCGPGYRPSKGYSGAVIVIWGLDRPTLVASERDRYERHDRVHPVGDLSFHVGEPLEDWTLRFDGRLNLGGTGKAVPVNAVGPAGKDGWPTVDVAYELVFQRDQPAYLYQENPEWDGLFDGHVDEVGRVTGTLAIDGETFEIDGRGSKDHSWGVRDWSRPKGWRWIDMLFPEGPEATLWRATFDGRRWLHDGAVFDDGRALPIDRFAERVVWAPRTRADRPETFDFAIGAGENELRGRAEILNVVPLLFGIAGEDGRRTTMWNDRTIYRCETDDGRQGVGSAEFQFRVPERGPAPRPLTAPEIP